MENNQLEPAVLATNKHHEDGYYQTFTRPDGEFAEAWRKHDRDYDRLFAAEDIKEWIGDEVLAIGQDHEELSKEAINGIQLFANRLMKQIDSQEVQETDE